MFTIFIIFLFLLSQCLSRNLYIKRERVIQDYTPNNLPYISHLDVHFFISNYEKKKTHSIRPLTKNTALPLSYLLLLCDLLIFFFRFVCRRLTRSTDNPIGSRILTCWFITDTAASTRSLSLPALWFKILRRSWRSTSL